MNKKGKVYQAIKPRQILAIYKWCSKHDRFIPNWHLLDSALFTCNLKNLSMFIVFQFVYMYIMSDWFKYGPDICTMDIGCTINSIIINVLFYCFLLKGRLKGFYRWDYRKFSKIINTYVYWTYGSFFRLFFMINHNGFHLSGLNFVINFNYLIGVLLLNIIFIGFLFYPNKQVSIEDYSTVTILLQKYYQQQNSDVHIFDIQNQAFNSVQKRYLDENKLKQNQKKSQKSQKTTLSHTNIDVDGFKTNAKHTLELDNYYFQNIEPNNTQQKVVNDHKTQQKVNTKKKNNVIYLNQKRK